MSHHIDELFERQGEICETGDYAGITQVARFNTKVVGVTYENRQDVLASLEPGVELLLRRDSQNEYDANAIAVTLLDGIQLAISTSTSPSSSPLPWTPAHPTMPP